ncbi:MAG: dTDP-4-dehydrorhamnose reductase [Aureispira sp.]
MQGLHILVTGAQGQVGNELQVLAKNYPATQWLFTDYTELDITNKAAVQNFFEQHQFDYCINCAAYTAVDKAEQDSDKATAVNVEGVKNLALASKITHTRLLHLSTDYVYHNTQNTPFKEEDVTSPQSVYGKTKLSGELEALAIQEEMITVRTSWVYSSFGNNFVKTMLRLGTEREQLSVIFDQIGSPTYARDLAQALLDIIIHKANHKEEAFGGVYHYSNEGVCSWYDFAHAIFEHKEIACQLLPIETKDYPTPAQRPPFSLLNKAKIKADFDLAIPHWRESLYRCLELL